MTISCIVSQLGWFANPIFSKTGNYPSLMRTQVNRISTREGRSRSRLPVFNERWIEAIRGSVDFLGLNYYTSNTVESTEMPEGQVPSYNSDALTRYGVKPEWKRAASEWLSSVPLGLRDLLRYCSFLFPPL